MRIGSINGNMAVSAYGTSREESAIRKQILSLKKELQQVSSSEDEDEEQEAAIKQREIEQQIARLEQKLQQLKREKNQNSTVQLSTDTSEEEMVKEPGKGTYVDTYI
ncbi:MAG: FlxA-like family protein [Lachnospiraceae bacterium]|nr:FlxA-like family protein [Lachnospiraceae bacterium]